MKYKQSRSNKYGGYVTGLGTHMEERGKLLIDRRNKMSKQLKNKEVWLHHIYNDAAYKIRVKAKKQVTSIRGFVKQDVKTAVEYLKENIKRCDIPKGKNLVLELIDDAFFDVKEKGLFRKLCDK